MSWLPEREKLDAQQRSAVDFVSAQDENTSLWVKLGRL